MRQYLFKKTIEPNDNFFIAKKGVVFSSTPYEISPYAVGQITAIHTLLRTLKASYGRYLQ